MMDLLCNGADLGHPRIGEKAHGRPGQHALPPIGQPIGEQLRLNALGAQIAVDEQGDQANNNNEALDVGDLSHPQEIQDEENQQDAKAEL